MLFFTAFWWMSLDLSPGINDLRIITAVWLANNYSNYTTELTFQI